MSFSAIDWRRVDLACLYHANRLSFLATETGSRLGWPRLRLHFAGEGLTRRQRQAIAAPMSAAVAGAGVRFKAHSGKALAGPRSLEGFLTRFVAGRIVHDPTGAFSRAEKLVRFATCLRSSLDDRLAGIYWQPQSRVLFIVLNLRRYAPEMRLRVKELAAAEDLVVATLVEACGEEARRYLPRIRIGFELPVSRVVPIDEASVPARHGVFSWLCGWWKLSALGAAFGVSAVGMASAGEMVMYKNNQGSEYSEPAQRSRLQMISPTADLVVAPPPVVEVIREPAVSAVNGKLAVEGGLWDEDGLDSSAAVLATGSLTMPVGHQFGLQADGLLGFRDDHVAAGLGGHAFWRDPNVALIGLMGGFATLDGDGIPDRTLGLIGAEAEIYLRDFTVLAAAGYHFGKRVEEGAFGSAELLWYASDNLAFSGGALFSESRDWAARFTGEFQPGFAAFPGLTFFGEGVFGDDDYVRVMAGLRLYFGPDRTLKDRHRRDDPHTNAARLALDLLEADGEDSKPYADRE